MGTIFQIHNAFLVAPLVRYVQDKINVQLVQDLTITMEESANYVLNPVRNVQIHHFVQAALQQATLFLREAV